MARRWTVLAAAALAASVLATTSRAEDAPSAPAARRVTSREDLKDLLREAGYAVTGDTAAGWRVESKRRSEKEYAKETLFQHVLLSADGLYVILSSPPARIPPDRKPPRTVLIDMLGFNAGDGGIQFCLGGPEKDLIFLLRFVDNRALIPTSVSHEIEEFFDAVRSTVRLWDAQGWGAAPPPDAPAMDDAPPEGMR